MGRPKESYSKQIEGEQVRKLAALHCTVSEIADVLGCERTTIYRRFKEELDRGRAEGKTDLRRKQLEAASRGSASMLIWLGKQILGQKDQQEIVAIDEEEKRLSDEEVDQMLALITGNENGTAKNTAKESSTASTSE